MKAIFFPNGNTRYFDQNGQQVPELQQSWLLLYVEFLKSKNIDPLTIEYELPNGKARLFKTDDGYNWQF